MGSCTICTTAQGWLNAVGMVHAEFPAPVAENVEHSQRYSATSVRRARNGTMDRCTPAPSRKPIGTQRRPCQPCHTPIALQPVTLHSHRPLAAALPTLLAA